MDVMIVEDERIISLAVSRMVEGMGHRVLATIPSAEEALERLELLRPDLVLMDIHLQGPMDGIDACVAIHERWDIPCVYTSAYTDEATKVRASATKPLAFLGKPLSVSSVTEIFERIKAINPRSRGGGCLLA